MKKFKKVMLGAVATTLAVTSLAGCGKKESAKETETKKQTETETATVETTEKETDKIRGIRRIFDRKHGTSDRTGSFLWYFCKTGS